MNKRQRKKRVKNKWREYFSKQHFFGPDIKPSRIKVKYRLGFNPERHVFYAEHGYLTMRIELLAKEGANG